MTIGDAKAMRIYLPTTNVLFQLPRAEGCLQSALYTRSRLLLSSAVRVVLPSLWSVLPLAGSLA